MRVLDNIKLGRHAPLKTGAPAAPFFTLAARLEEAELRRDIEIDLIRKAPVGALSYGLQKRVELARAPAMQARLLLLDEPVAGMNCEETEDMARFILEMRRERGLTVLMVEKTCPPGSMAFARAWTPRWRCGASTSASPSVVRVRL